MCGHSVDRTARENVRSRSGSPHEVAHYAVISEERGTSLAGDTTEIIVTTLIRAGLVILFFDQLIVGGWNAISPETFYRYFPTVDLTPPYSEHYARDFGGATLGIGLLLGIAIVKPRAHFIIPGALAFSVYSVPHFFYHVNNLAGATVLEAIGLTAANALVALIGIGIVLATIVRDQKSSDSATARAAD